MSTTPRSGSEAPALRLADLHVCLRNGDPVVEGVDLELAPGEILGLVGESGSGKTTTALAMLGYCAAGLQIRAGELELRGRPQPIDDSIRRLRGSVISYIPQDPGRALNPSLRIADAIKKIVRVHRDVDDPAGVAMRMLDAVGLPTSREFARRFPHELSGGQQQRVLIAAALSCEPAVVVLDEPTTGLDVVTQAKILAELRRLREELRVAMVYVSHDLSVVAQIADRIAVMYAGRIVEEGPTAVVLRTPQHPYTHGLLASIPDHVRPRRLEPMSGIALGVGERPMACAFAARCPQRTEVCVAELPPLAPIAARHDVRCFHWERTPPVPHVPLEASAAASAPDQEPLLLVEHLRTEHRSMRETVVASEDATFALHRSACVALVGESGSGKTTIARAIAGLHPVSGGRIVLDGEELPDLAAKRSVDQRRRIQLIFQNPAEALNPRHTIREAVGRPAQLLRGFRGTSLRGEVDRLLESVRLPTRLGDRYPHELSGGERQRVAIARALAADPDVLLCDEITSALDVSVQAAVLKLLNELRRELGLGVLFITHDLGVVATVADDVLILERGIVCERGSALAVLHDPQHPYTQQLLTAAPSIADADGAIDTAPSPHA